MRIHLVGLVEGHRFLAEPCLVVLVFLAQGDHLRLELLHLLHRLVALVSQGPEDQLDQDGQDDDRDPVIVDVAVEELEDDEQRDGQPLEPVAEIDGVFQADVLGLEDGVILRSQIEGIVENAGLAGRDHVLRPLEADGDQIAAVLRHPEARQRRVLRDQRGDEVFALEAAPGDVGTEDLVRLHLTDLGAVDVLRDVGDGAVMAVTVRRRGGIDVLIPGQAAVLVQGGAREVMDPDLQLEAEFVRVEGEDLFDP